MGRADYLEEGGWNAICSMCGRKFKAGDLKRHWQGQWRCTTGPGGGCWEPRHPQDFVRALPDGQSPPWTQPPAAAIFVRFCTPNSRTALPGFAIPGCALPGFIDPAFDPSITGPL